MKSLTRGCTSGMASRAAGYTGRLGRDSDVGGRIGGEEAAEEGLGFSAVDGEEALTLKTRSFMNFTIWSPFCF
jgi:hypothetical protein